MIEFLLALTLSCVSFLLASEFIEDLINKRKKRRQIKYSGMITESPNVIISESRANDRSNKIDEFLNNNIDKDFIEIPPGYEKKQDDYRVKKYSNSNSNSNSNSKSLLSKRLKREKEDEGLLLMGRVRDTLKLIDEKEDLEFFSTNENNLLITLEMYPEYKEGVYSRKVVIRSKYFPKSLFEKLKEIEEWLGIGIEYIPDKSNHRLFGRKLTRIIGSCKEDQSKSGVIGGAFKFINDHIIQITCNHVIPDRCPCRISNENKIDISILKPFLDVPEDKNSCLHNGRYCFLFVQPNHIGVLQKSLSSMQININYIINNLYNKEDVLLVQKKHPNVNAIQGVVTSPAAYYDSQNYQCITVRSFSRSIIVQWIYNLFRFRFSKPGDSGSWVFDESGKWIGMVLAGNPRNNQSFVLPSWHIIDYLESLNEDPNNEVINFDDILESSLIYWS